MQLEERIMRLIAVGASITANCQPCLQTNIAKARENGCDEQEIAEVLGITLDTVKIRLHRARDLIRKGMIENCPPYWVVDNIFLPELKKEDF